MFAFLGISYARRLIRALEAWGIATMRRETYVKRQNVSETLIKGQKRQSRHNA